MGRFYWNNFKWDFLIWLLIFIPGIIILAISKSPLFSLGQATGVTCLAALALSIILGCRSYFLNYFFGSPSRFYRIHHQVSVVATCLLLLHIFFSAVPFWQIDLMTAVDFLFDFKEKVIWSGWGAFTFIMTSVFLAYKKKLNREIWKWLHRLQLLSFPLIIIHFWPLAERFDWPFGFSFILWLGAFVILGMHFILPKLMRNYREFEVVGIRNLSSNIIEIKLKAKENGIEFTPGQFIYLSVDCKKGCKVGHEFHPFSIDSAPDGKEVSLAVKSLGDDTHKLQHLEVGNLAIVEGPYGDLLSDIEIRNKQLWIAGGIGITPFVSYLRQVKKQSQTVSDIILLLFIKETADNVFASEIKDCLGKNFKVVISDMMSAQEFYDHLPIDWKSRDIVISGPGAMVRKFKKDLFALGAKKINSEEFDF